MSSYLMAVRAMEKFFSRFTVRKIPRDDNAEADALAKVAATKGSLAPDMFYEVLKCKSVDCTQEALKFVNAIASKD